MQLRLEPAVDALQDFLSENDFSGVVRVSVGNDVLLEYAAGYANRADRVPNQVDTRFGTASLTKSFTAAAICRLVDQGTAGFESRVVDLLPPSKRPSTISDAVTLHHLLTHTSGIADYYDEATLGPEAFADVWRQHPSYLFREPIDFLPLFQDLPARREPGGTRGLYCNAGYILLGLMIEQLSGRSYRDYVEAEIFTPAGMSDSAFFALDEVRERVAIGYIEEGRGRWTSNHDVIPIIGGPDGGAFSTVRDLTRFLDALESDTLFTQATWTLMRTPHVELEDACYGYGLWIQAVGDSVAFGAAGADPGFSARAFRYPDLDANVTMLGNTIGETDAPMRVFRDAIAT